MTLLFDFYLWQQVFYGPKRSCTASAKDGKKNGNFFFQVVPRHSDNMFHVHSIFPEPLEIFSLKINQILLSVRWCKEPITQLCRLKVKVTLQGYVITF